MELNHEKVNFWLDTNTKTEFKLKDVVKPHSQAEFLTIISSRADYTYDGLKVRKCPVKTVLSDCEDFFSKFVYPETHESSFGCFQNYELKKFTKQFLQCAKSQNPKIPTATKSKAIQTLAALKTYLLTGKVTYIRGSMPLQ